MLLLFLALPLTALARPPRGTELTPAYAQVRPGYTMHFPADHGAHPGFALEWWYLTGFLEPLGPEGQRTFQVTFFRHRPKPGTWLQNPSRFTPRQLYSAHVALGDPDQAEFRDWQRVGRSGLGRGRAASGQLAVQIGDWRLEAAARHQWQAELDIEDKRWRLDLEPQGEPIIHGIQGISLKDPEGDHASYYYSYPWVQVSGKIPLDGELHWVQGRAWMDHEWTSGILPEGATGWEWVGLRFEDGTALMAFRIREADGSAQFQTGSWIGPGGAVTHLHPADLDWQPRRYWHSEASGTRYPIAWSLTVKDRRLQIEPLFPNQELVSSGVFASTYWEGAVRVTGGKRGEGFLEITHFE